MRAIEPRFPLWTWGLPLLLVVSWGMSLSLGAFKIPPLEMVRILWEAFRGQPGDDVASSVLLSLRLSRVGFGALAGAGLALGGVCMQALFRNPLADPGLMGLSSGAALAAAALTISAGSLPEVMVHPLAIPATAFLGGLFTTGLVYRVSNRGGRIRVESMLLMGIAVNALCGALIGVLLLVADDAQLRNITFWSFGSLGRVGGTAMAGLGVALLPAFVLVWMLRHPMNLLLSGEADAASLGVHVERTKALLVGCSCWMVSLVVAWSGLIGFVGLVIPHITRLIFGPSHRTLVPASLMLGAMFLPLADGLCRTVIAPAELPIGMVTALMGTPFFIYLLIRRGVRA